MSRQHNALLAAALFTMCTLVFFPSSLHAGTASDRVAVETDVKTGLAKDLSQPYAAPLEKLSGRTCLDGRQPGQEAELIEFWASLECSYCGIRELVQAQQEHPDWCVVVRHIPASPEGLRKALSFEALRKFSTSAALTFWDAVIPKADAPMPRPYEGALMQAYADAVIAEKDFSAALTGDAADLVNADIVAGRGIISSTPTYVLRGIRFGACDFTAAQLEQALALARRARSGDSEAAREIGEVITRGRMGEKML